MDHAKCHQNFAVERAESVFPEPGFATVIMTVQTNQMKRAVTTLTPAVSENFSVEAVESASLSCLFVTVIMIVLTNQMKKTAKELVALTTFNAATRGSAFLKIGSVMAIGTVLTIQTKKTALKCLHVAAENSSVVIARVFM